MARRVPTSVWDVPRNDLEAARAFYAARGQVTRDELEVLLKLQDDPAELAAEAARWRVGAKG
jgi:hypothetical protein